MPDRGCVVLLGDFSEERLDLTDVVRDFCWSVVQSADLSGLREIGREHTVIAVLAKVETGGDTPWSETMRAIRAAAPRARIIVCHKGVQANARTEMIDAGAFGVLLSPLAHSEVRQSLGFVWASKITPLNHTRHTVSPAKKIRAIDTAARRVGAA